MTIRISLLFIAASMCACATTAPSHAEDVREYGAQLFTRPPDALRIAASRSLADLGYAVDSVGPDRVIGHRAAATETFIDSVSHGPEIARTVDVEIVTDDAGFNYVVVVPRVFANGHDITDDPSARAGEIREMQTILAYTAAELPADFDALCFFFPQLEWWRRYYDDKPVRADWQSPPPIAAHVIASSTPVTHGPPLARVERPHPRQPH